MDESHRSPAPGSGGDQAGSTPTDPSVPPSGGYAGYSHDSARPAEPSSPWAPPQPPAATPPAVATPPSAPAQSTGGFYSHGPQAPQPLGAPTSAQPASGGQYAGPPPAGPFPAWSNAGAAQQGQPTAPFAAYPPSAPQRPARRRGPLATAIVGGALAIALVAGGAGAAVGVALSDHNGSAVTINQTSSEPASKSNDTATVESAAATALKSVVTINVTATSGSGTGSGVVLDNSGHILTNNHVVEDAADGGTITVVLPNGTQRSATIVGRDPSSDIAVIKVANTSGLTPATFSTSSTVKVGEAVLAIGAPLGLSNTVTEGIVSALNRPVRTSSDTSSANAQNTVLDAVQTDAAINPGNSGGALVDLSGHVIGINSAIATVSSASSGGGQEESQSGNIGVGFAIPVDTALSVAKQLISTGTAVHATLGVSAQDTQSGTGAQIQAVTSGSGADKAGLKAGDVVTAIGSRQVSDTDGLVAAVRSHTPGESVSVTYTRNGKTAKVTVKLSSSST
jgi:putative serine protease PepD